MPKDEIKYKVIPIKKNKVDGDEETCYHVYWETRYIVINEETGEVLDDAQGYGYKSYQNAVKGYSYQRKTKEQKQQLKIKKKKCQEWWSKHKSIANFYEAVLLDALKDNEKLTAKQCKEIIQHQLDEKNITLEDGLTINDLYKNF